MTATCPDFSPSAARAGVAGLEAGCARMRALGQSPEAVQAFRHYYALLAQGASGFIPSRDIQPVEHLTDYEELDGYELTGYEMAEKVVVLKLNGGLGTSMGLDVPKCLIPVREGMTFLEFIVHQVMYLRQRLDKHLPLLFMNSFHTRTATLAALADFPQLRNGLALDFEQHRIPKLAADSLAPVDWPADPAKEWCPPGHGNLYPALRSTGLLDALLDEGYVYAFVSNADNLGAVLDIKILGYMVEYAVPMLMEVAYRTPSDRKGGHLAQDHRGHFLIREYAQCPAAEQSQFQDIHTYQFFNTNNIWLHLPSLRTLLEAEGGFLRLPPIFNRKPVDPTDPASPMIIQLESAMGSAISVIPGASALRVPRHRFLPVKHCEDLLVMQSDVYQRNHQFRLVMNPKRITPRPPRRPPHLDLDPVYFGSHPELQQRFPQGPPSLVRCTSLQIRGDVRFGRDVVLQGDVAIINGTGAPYCVPDGTLIQGDLRI